MLQRHAPRPSFIARQRWLADHVDHDAFVMRLHARTAADAPWLRVRALGSALAWMAEAKSRFSEHAHVRRTLPAHVLVPTEPDGFRPSRRSP